MKELDWEWVEVTPSSDIVVVAFLAGPFFLSEIARLFSKQVFWIQKRSQNGYQNGANTRPFWSSKTMGNVRVPCVFAQECSKNEAHTSQKLGRNWAKKKSKSIEIVVFWGPGRRNSFQKIL